MGARVYYTARYSVGPVGAGRARVVCERCGGRARFAGFGWGDLCAGCRGVVARIKRAAVTELAGGYGLGLDEITEQLADEQGIIKTRAPSPPAALLRWAESPGDAADYVTGLGAGAHGLQLALVARVLWGVSLWDGVCLQAYPRDHYPADCIEWGLVRWVYDSPLARRWLLVYGYALRAAWAESRGADHSASELIVWLSKNSFPSLIRRRAGYTPPPAFRSCGGEE